MYFERSVLTEVDVHVTTVLFQNESFFCNVFRGYLLNALVGVGWF